MDSTKLTGILISGTLLAFVIWQLGVLRERYRVVIAKKDRMTAELFSFLFRQTMRRINLSLLFALASVCIAVGCLISWRDHPRVFLISWAAATVLLLWGMILALFDFIAVRLHYSIEERQNEAERIGLEYALKKMHDSKQSDSDEKN